MADNELKLQLPTVALRGMTILPNMIIHFDLSRKKSILAVENAMMDEQRLFLVAQRDANDTDPGFDQVYHVGTVAEVKQVTKLPNNIVRIMVEGLQRAAVNGFDESCETYLLADLQEIEPDQTVVDELEEAAMARNLEELFERYSSYFPKIGKSLEAYFREQYQLCDLIDQIAINLPIGYENKQAVLEAVSVSERYEILSKILMEEVGIAKIRIDLSQKVKSKVEKNQREYVLREQLGFIRSELGEDTTFSDADQFTAELEKLKAGEDVKEKIKKEISRFKSISGNSSESSLYRSYIETLLEIPWEKMSEDNTDISRAEKILAEQHYGLENVKERILEFLAVRALTNQGESPIICLVGPPGTGKTSIAKSIAESMNKEYVRICLGGVRDEAEIRGHRKTYIGAMPGRIITGLKQAGVKNPLMLLDEIDKVSSDYKGDTSSALLEVLDSEQNSRFRDNYVEIPVDLSQVMFIATANATSTIPRPLLDRMEIIEVTSYTANEKFHIGKEHLIPKQLCKNGLSEERLEITDTALKNMIQFYTREAGVRGLERRIGELCRKAAREILQNGADKVRITPKNLEKYLGKEKYSLDKANRNDDIGIVRGLAWTSVGGVTLQIEVNMMPGKGQVELTGQLGDVMKESALAGMSYIRSISKEYKITPDIFRKQDFHIHIPEGAVPKDGPSAGITMATALLSAIIGRKVRSDVAMTGEITLRGRVLPIGGLKEKVLAAKTAGIKTVIVPKENRKDIEEISREIKTGLNIVYAETMKDVLETAFAAE